MPCFIGAPPGSPVIDISPLSRLDGEIIAGLVRARARAPIARDRAVDEARIERREVRVAEAESLERALFVILDEHIDLCRHLADDALAIRVLQIDRDQRFERIAAM